MADDDTCAICLQPLSASGRQWLECSHALHESCIAEMRRFGMSAHCPICRRTSAALRPLLELLRESVVHSFVEEWDKLHKCLSEALELGFEDGVLGAVELRLGMLFLHGQGVEKHFGKAIELFEASRGRGNADAVWRLGAAYLLDGEGVEKNVGKAIELFEEARLCDDAQVAAQACIDLGGLYEDGVHVVQDLEMAVKLYEDGHGRGSSEAGHRLALMYSSGKGVERNERKAFEYAKEAHERDQREAHTWVDHEEEDEDAPRRTSKVLLMVERPYHFPSSVLLAQMYLDGRGTGKNKKKALEILEEACRQGNTEACVKLGNHCLAQYVLQNDQQAAKRALELFQEAYSDDVAGAAFPLCMIYQEGFGGVEQSTEKAADFMQEALREGDSDAETFLDSPAGAAVNAVLAARREQEVSAGDAEAKLSAHMERSPQVQAFVTGSAAARASECDLKAAFEESIREADARAVPWNGPVSETILRSRLMPEPVVLFEASRTPSALRDNLFANPKLQEISRELERHRLSVNLDSGGHSGAVAFLKPREYGPALRAVEGMNLRARHVMVSADWEEEVRRVITDTLHTGVKRRRLLTKAKPLEADVKHTFIHLDIPSSLCSEVSSKPATH